MKPVLTFILVTSASADAARDPDGYLNTWTQLMMPTRRWGLNGGHVRNLVIPPGAQLNAAHRPELLGGVTVITGRALALHAANWPESLYVTSPSVPGVSKVEFTAIPYCANANRARGEMQVWMAETANRAEPLPAN